MGSMDFVVFGIPLDEEWPEEKTYFQTKDLDRAFNRYRVEDDGQLYCVYKNDDPQALDRHDPLDYTGTLAVVQTERINDDTKKRFEFTVEFEDGIMQGVTQRTVRTVDDPIEEKRVIAAAED